MEAQGETKTSRGTVNIALANANGIVLLTDSVQSHHESDGWHYVQPVQKLFRLDDKTVCSIAGFASETGWPNPQLDTDVAGIIADFHDQLSKKPVPEFEAKLRAIGFLVGFYIDLVANRFEVVAGTGTPADFHFEMIVAGYDVDQQPKLEQLVLTPVVREGRDGHKYWSHTTTTNVAQLGRELVPLLGGIRIVSQKVLDDPERFGDSEVVNTYKRAKAEDRGESLTLDEMAALASQMAAQTAKLTRAVGPPDQVAILANGKILKLDQPHFHDPPRPMKFILMISLKVQGEVMVATASRDVHFIWIRSEFVGIRNPQLRLDGQFFYGCEIRDSIVTYGGSLTDFGSTNTVVNTSILPGSPVGPASMTEMLRIMNGFKWRPPSEGPPEGPPLPPTMGPK